MALKPITHVNLVDDGGQVFCYKEGDIVAFDGPFVSKTCWQCPLWVGLAGGYGVECKYQDENLGDKVEKMTYRNAEDARDHAPDTVSNLDSIADKDAVKMNDMRAKLLPNPDETANEVKQDKQDAANKDMETASASGADATAPDTGDGLTAPVDTVPPVAPADNTLQMKKANSLEVLKAIQTASMRGHR